MLVAPLLLSAALDGSPIAPNTQAYTGTDPVRVASCSLSAPIAWPNTFGVPTLTTATGTLAISFLNQNEKPISSVAFNVSDGRATSRIVDAGTFKSIIASARPSSPTSPAP
jgi:hypothetical protein